jgi:hypothetical protein
VGEDHACIHRYKRVRFAPVALSLRTWTGFTVADVVVWIIADSQGPDFLAFKATGAFLSVLKVLWVVSLLVFIILVVLGIVSLVKSRRQPTRA